MCCHLHWVQPLRPVHRARGQGQQLVRHPVLTLKRSELKAATACIPWLLVFDQICKMSGDPGLVHGDTLEIELTPLAYLWAARDASSAIIWLRNKGILGPASLRGARLSGIDLRGAYLRNADFTCADLRNSDCYVADFNYADLTGANLRGADLRGANLYSANLGGARRLQNDPPIPGWRYYHGYLVEHNP